MSKRKATSQRPFAAAALSSNFTRGLVAAGLLAAIQNRGTNGRPANREVARLALQGGVALAAGVATAESLRDSDYLGALAAFTGGAVGVMALEKLLTSETPDLIEETDIG